MRCLCSVIISSLWTKSLKRALRSHNIVISISRDEIWRINTFVLFHLLMIRKLLREINYFEYTKWNNTIDGCVKLLGSFVSHVITFANNFFFMINDAHILCVMKDLSRPRALLLHWYCLQISWLIRSLNILALRNSWQTTRVYDSSINRRAKKKII